MEKYLYKNKFLWSSDLEPIRSVGKEYLLEIIFLWIIEPITILLKIDPKKRILKLNGYYLKGPEIEDDLEDIEEI